MHVLRLLSRVKCLKINLPFCLQKPYSFDLATCHLFYTFLNYFLYNICSLEVQLKSLG